MILLVTGLGSLLFDAGLCLSINDANVGDRTVQTYKVYRLGL